jgi:uncharacterized protein YbbC (DUF1343 family)
MKIASLIVYLFLFVAIGHSQVKNKPAPDVQKTGILPGANQLSEYLPILQGKSVAVFANQTSTIGAAHLVDSLLKKGIKISRIFSPEHGFRGTADAGEEVNNLTDPLTGLPVISLYGNKVKPSAEDLKDIDVIVFDIQDVGTRFYTFISSLQKIMEAAVDNKKILIVLDRPNPNGFYVDGPVLDTAFRSFVGMQSIPVVYGMTIGEYASMLVGEKLLPGLNERTKANLAESKSNGTQLVQNGQFQLIIVRNRNYTHKSKYILPVRPSPNLPNMQAVYLYPSICFFEGTTVSLGRGTDKPFQQFGHPAFPGSLYHFTPESSAGAKNPPLLNQQCFGFDLSRIDLPKEIDGHIQLKWLIKAYRLYPDKEKFFLASNYFNKLAGNSSLMQQVKSGKTEAEIRKSWEPAIRKFKIIRKKYLLYPDFE